MSDGWMSGVECNPWVVAPDGSYLSSGDNRRGPRVRSTLSLRLHFKTAGRLWFTYRSRSRSRPHLLASQPPVALLYRRTCRRHAPFRLARRPLACWAPRVSREEGRAACAAPRVCAAPCPGPCPGPVCA